MEANFDKAALQYDATFTNSGIGQLQRQSVYGKLSEQLAAVQNILEINCGTGEDAIWLAKQKFNVTATDISAKMIEMAKSKVGLENLSFIKADINAIATTFSGEKFDLIFSNFGGLNCLPEAELANFFQNAASLLSGKGKLVLVIMPKNTLWEQGYFLAKGQFGAISRRKKAMVLANVDGENVPTYYFNPKDVVNLAKAYFEPIAQEPIGFFVPPSYLEPFFSQKKGFLRFLNRLEKGISHWPFLSKYADHYIITLQKR